MKLVIIALSCLVACEAHRVPQGRALQQDHSLAKILKATQQQTVDGSYGFAYESDNGQSRNEVSNNGVVEGSYSYVDADGTRRTVNYKAGPEGFQVEGDHLPKAGAPQRAQPQQAAPRPVAPRPVAPRPVPFQAPVQRAQAPPAQVRSLPPPTAIEQQQLAEQQRLLQQTIDNHQEYLAGVTHGGRVTQQSAPRQQPQFQQQQPQFQAQQPQFQAQPQFQQQPRFQAQPQFQPRPQFQQQPQHQDFRNLQLPVQQLGGFSGAQQFRAPAATHQQFAPGQFRQAAQPQSPFTQFAQQPGQGFNYLVQN